MDSIGIDYHKNNSQVCILTEDGELIEKRIRTTRGRFAAMLGEREQARIVIEASSESDRTLRGRAFAVWTEAAGASELTAEDWPSLATASLG